MHQIKDNAQPRFANYFYCVAAGLWNFLLELGL